jgi:hypothetical protein
MPVPLVARPCAIEMFSLGAIQILRKRLPLATTYLKLVKSRTRHVLSLYCFCRLFRHRGGHSVRLVVCTEHSTVGRCFSYQLADSGGERHSPPPCLPCKGMEGARLRFFCRSTTAHGGMD